MRKNSKQCGVVLKLRYITFFKEKDARIIIHITSLFQLVNFLLKNSYFMPIKRSFPLLDERKYPVMYSLGIKQYLLSLTYTLDLLETGHQNDILH